MITILLDNEYKNELYPDNSNAGLFVFTAREKDEILGSGEVILKDNYAQITSVKTVSGMEGLEHGIFKSLLNFTERRGVYDCICALDKPSMMKRLGFELLKNKWADSGNPDEKVYYLNLEGYFEKHC